MIGEYDANGNALKTYGYRPDSTWTTDPLFLKQGLEYYFYQNDHLGTPQKLVAMNGAVVWSATYTAFGDAVVDVSTVTNNLRFPGQYYDAETGLFYNGFRYYEPGIGRYLQTDPIGFLGKDVNWYEYTGNNSINRKDFLGLSSHALVVEEVLSHPEWWPVFFAAAAKAGPVILAGAAGMYVGEEYIGAWLRVNEPILVKVNVQKILDSIPDPGPEPDPIVRPTEIFPIPRSSNCFPDDFRGKCRLEDMDAVKVYRLLNPVHASLGVEGDIVGWHPVDKDAQGNPRMPWNLDDIPEGASPFLRGLYVGRLQDDSEHIMDPLASYSTVIYLACPKSVDNVKNSINAYRFGHFNLFNLVARNCAGWVCEVLRSAGIQPITSKQLLYTPQGDVPCDTPGLKPVHLMPEGRTKKFIDLGAFE